MDLERVSQVDHDALCTFVGYNPYTCQRHPCLNPAVHAIGDDYGYGFQFRYCRYHWEGFRIALEEETRPTNELHWLAQQIVDREVDIITNRANDALTARRAAGQETVAHIIRARVGMRSVVYFIQAGDDGPIKIGTSTDVHSRYRDLQVATPLPLHLRATQPGDRHTESEYHRVFAHHRIGGEWFAPVPKLLATITALQNVGQPR